MVYFPETKLIDCDVEIGDFQWSDFVNGGNGCLYGIPCEAPRVVEFNLEDKRTKEIGPDLGSYWGKYWKGVKANNGSIYCMPYNAGCLLKIIPGEGQHAEVQILQEKKLPRGIWEEGALANDGCIYYFPGCCGRILKLDPNDGDSLSLVGEEMSIGGVFEERFIAAVLGNNGFIYGIANDKIIKFNPLDHNVFYVGRNFDRTYSWTRAAVLADDGNIYAANPFGQILRIDTAQNDWKIIGNGICDRYTPSWGFPVLGADKCIYFPPAGHDRVLKFNPITQSISQIGESYGEDIRKWQGAVLASNGFIYSIPFWASDILQIDSRHVNEQVVAMIQSECH